MSNFVVFLIVSSKMYFCKYFWTFYFADIKNMIELSLTGFNIEFSNRLHALERRKHS